MCRVKKPLSLPRPESITVGGKTLRVKVVPRLVLNEGMCGSCCMNNLTIEIDDGLIPINKTETLIHEIFEAINKVWLADALNHDDIDRLGEAFYQVLGDMGIEIDWS